MQHITSWLPFGIKSYLQTQGDAKITPVSSIWYQTPWNLLVLDITNKEL